MQGQGGPRRSQRRQPGLAAAQGTPFPPLEYFGSNPQHEAQTKGELEKRKTLGMCFTCPNKWVTYTQNNLDCPFH